MVIPTHKATPETMPLANSVLNNAAMRHMTPAERATAMKKRRRAGQQMNLSSGAPAGMDGQSPLNPAASVLS